MTTLTCMRSRGLMDRRVSGLSDAERLRLEEHVSGCAACAGHSQTLQAVVTLAQSQDGTLSASARQRVIASALAHSVAQVNAATETPSAARGVRVALSVGALAAAATLAVWFGGSRAEPLTRLPSEQATPSVAIKASTESFIATVARHVVVEGAELDLQAGTEIVWDATHARVTLQRGQVRAYVASRAGKQAFSVRTPKLTVVVIGTVFDVSVETVRVHEGVVRVEDNAGEVLHAGLVAGEGWPLVVSPLAVAAQPQNTPPQNTKPQPQTSETPRAQLDPAQRAETETLVAEALQVEGKLSRAIAQYDRVAREYRQLGAGDNAAFAAARLTQMTGDQANALLRFQRYLRDHPQGRFRDEATRAVTQLQTRDAAQTLP